MIRDFVLVISRLLKLMWTVALIWSLYIFFWILFFSFLTQSPDGIQMTWLSFILPNLINVIFLLLYTRELIFGYRIKQLQSTVRSLILLIICSLYILTTQFDFYFYIVDHEDWTLNVPLVLILSSMIGLIVHRLISLRGILDKTSTADTWNGMKS